MEVDEKLQAEVTLTTETLMGSTCSLFTELTGLEFDDGFIERVRWWQAWRWHLTWRRDYTLSRTCDMLLELRMRQAFLNGMLDDVSVGFIPTDPLVQ